MNLTYIADKKTGELSQKQQTGKILINFFPSLDFAPLNSAECEEILMNIFLSSKSDDLSEEKRA
jgi:hypothetical protein